MKASLSEIILSDRWVFDTYVSVLPDSYKHFHLMIKFEFVLFFFNCIISSTFVYLELNFLSSLAWGAFNDKTWQFYIKSHFTHICFFHTYRQLAWFFVYIQYLLCSYCSVLYDRKKSRIMVIIKLSPVIRRHLVSIQYFEYKCRIKFMKLLLKIP